MKGKYGMFQWPQVKIPIVMKTISLQQTIVALSGCALAMAAKCGAVSLDRNVGTPTAYNWTAANTWAKDSALTPVFNVLKQYGIPSATIGYQFNPSPTSIPYAPPSAWRSPQAWWMAGFGLDYRSPMRVASVSKPITDIVYENTPALKALYTQSFYFVWGSKFGALPAPLDNRVKSITVRQLLDHTGGFDNSVIGYDPAFQGKSVDIQLPTIIKTKMLASNPGTNYSYSNFSYMILARLAEGVTGQSWISLVRARFPSGAPIYAASDTVAVPANSVPSAGAAEPGIYYVQRPDTSFDVTPMMGNGNIVSNITTLRWIGTQYWIGGTNAGKSFASAPSQVGASWTWIFNGSMPGTQAALVQYVAPSRRVASMCIITNTRVPNGDAFLSALNTAMVNALVAKFKNL